MRNRKAWKACNYCMQSQGENTPPVYMEGVAMFRAVSVHALNCDLPPHVCTTLACFLW